MKPDPSGLPNTYLCEAGEEIQAVTTLDHAPFLAQFPTEPLNGKWLSASTDQDRLVDKRTFKAGATGAEPVVIEVNYFEQIPDDAPYTTAKYTTTFTSLTNPGDVAQVVGVVVPKGQGPLLNQYTFNAA